MPPGCASVPTADGACKGGCVPKSSQPRALRHCGSHPALWGDKGQSAGGAGHPPSEVGWWGAPELGQRPGPPWSLRPSPSPGLSLGLLLPGPCPYKQVKGPRRPVLWCCRHTCSRPVPHWEPEAGPPRRKSRQHVLARRAAIQVGYPVPLQGGRQDRLRGPSVCVAPRRQSRARPSPGHWACLPLPEGKEGAGLPTCLGRRRTGCGLCLSVLPLNSQSRRVSGHPALKGWGTRRLGCSCPHGHAVPVAAPVLPWARSALGQGSSPPLPSFPRSGSGPRSLWVTK